VFTDTRYYYLIQFANEKWDEQFKGLGIFVTIDKMREILLWFDLEEN